MSITPNTSPRVTNAAAGKPRRWCDLALLAGALVLVFGGFLGLAAATGWERSIAAIASLSWAAVGVLLAVSLVNYVARALRWHLFVRTIGLETSLSTSFQHFIGGFAMSVTPGRLGELIRMRWLRRHTGQPFERTAPLLLVDRAMDLGAMALLLALAVGFTASTITAGGPVAMIALCTAVIVTRPNLLQLAAEIGHRITGRNFPRLFVRIRRSARSLHAFGALRLLLPAVGLGLLGWFAEGYGFHLLLTWLGADIGLWKAVGIFIFATLAGGLTGAPGGLGGAEAALIGLLLLEGVPIEIALPATLIIRLTTFWFAVLIGWIVFPIAEIQSKRAQNALEG